MLGVVHHGEHDQCRQNPGAHHFDDGELNGPEVHRFDRVPNRGESISRHQGQCERPGKHVDAGLDVVDLTEYLSEDPLADDGSRDEHRQTHQEQTVCHRQVENVNIGDRLHLAVPGHHKDDETVA